MIEPRSWCWRHFRFSLGALLIFTALFAGSSELVARIGFVSWTILVPFWASVVGAVTADSSRQRFATAGALGAIGGAVGLYLMTFLAPRHLHMTFPAGISLILFIAAASGAVLGLVVGLSYDVVVRLWRRTSRSAI